MPIADIVYHVILYFFFYATLGWVWETIYCSILEKRFVYRGFLAGPYCPIYGFGVLILLYFLTPLKDNPVSLFVVALLVMSALEYVVSYVLEKIFHTRWWDYSKEKFNLNGRVALKSSLFWGAMSLVIIYGLQPIVAQWADGILRVTGIYVPLVIIIVMVTDTVLTLIRLSGLYKVARDLERRLKEAGEERLLELQDLAVGAVSRHKKGKLRLSERRILAGYSKTKAPAVSKKNNHASLRKQ